MQKVVAQVVRDLPVMQKEGTCSSIKNQLFLDILKKIKSVSFLDGFEKPHSWQEEVPWIDFTNLNIIRLDPF